MAEKLSIEIKLAGGEEIERQLADIGEAGQEAFGKIADAARQAGGFKNLKPEEVTAKLKEMGIVGKDALDKISGAVATATKFQRLADIVGKVEEGFAFLGRGAMGFARVLGPIGIAVAAVGTVVVKSMTEAQQAIRRVEEAAAKAGLSIEKFDKLRQGLEKGGISGAGIEGAILKIAAAAEKGGIDQVAKDLANLQEISTRGYGPMGTPELQRLIEAARQFGPVGDAAREALGKIGIASAAPIPSLQELAARFGSTREALAAFIAQLEGIKDPAERNAVAFRQMGDAGLEIARGINTGAISSRQFAQDVVAAGSTITQSMANTANVTTQSTNKMSSAWDRFQTNLLGGAGWESLKSDGVAAWSAFKNAGVAAWEAITGAINKAIDAIKTFLGLKPGGGRSGANPAPGMASGGPVGGRGTGTSDSNLAWVSRGEHIMPARAVRQPGMLALLEALRRSGGNLSRVLDGMGRYAAGGLVSMPAFAAGGVGSMSHVTIQFPGMPAIGGLRAPSDVVDALHKAAAMAQVRSGGRKPSRYT